MKKILQISNYLYPNRGGIEQIAQYIMNSLSEDGYPQRLICFNETARDGDHVCRRGETARDTVDGVEVTRCGCFAKIRSQSLSVTFHRELKRLLRDFRPDIVIFHYPNPLMAASLLRLLPDGTKLIVYWHLDIVKQKLLRLLFTGQNRRLLRRADLLIATSPPYVDGSPWLSAVREKCVIVPNCISAARMQPTDAAYAAAEEIRRTYPGKILCVAVGRHTQYKGFEYLIRAAKTLDSRFAFLITGAGEETEKLKQEAAGDPRICFLGVVDDTTLKGCLLAADIFCFPSITKNEAFGLALAEALYYGKPAVTFTIPGSGVNYVCPDGECGLEAPNRDVAAYSERLKRLGDDPALRERLGENGRKRAETLFMYPQFSDRIRRIIRDL